MLNNLIREEIFRLNKKVRKALTIINGANGISVFRFILFFDKNIMTKLTIVPIQKDKIIAKNPCEIPSIHPIPSTSLPSPKPIRRPFEKYHIRTNGRAISGPAIKV